MKSTCLTTPEVTALLTGEEVELWREVRPAPWVCDMKPCGGTGEQWITSSTCAGDCGCDHQGRIDKGLLLARFPYGKVGDTVICREAFWLVDSWVYPDWPCLLYEEEFVEYSKYEKTWQFRGDEAFWHDRAYERADGNATPIWGHKSAAIMPNWASRLHAQILSVSVTERDGKWFWKVGVRRTS